MCLLLLVNRFVCAKPLNATQGSTRFACPGIARRLIEKPFVIGGRLAGVTQRTIIKHREIQQRGREILIDFQRGHERLDRLVDLIEPGVGLGDRIVDAG